MERALAIYLNDHFAGATFGVALARRSLENNRDNEFGEFLRRLAEEVDADRQSLRSMLAELGVRVDRAKQAAAWARLRAAEDALRASIPSPGYP